MRKIKLTTIFLIVFVSAYTQHVIKAYDSILSLSISDKEKTLKIENYLKRGIKNKDLLQLYYKYSKWNWRNKRAHKAIIYAEKVIDSCAKKDSVLLKTNLFNLGIIYKKINIFDKSLAYFDKLIAISEPYELRLGSAYRVKGDIFDALGDFQRALENYESSERIFIRNNNKPSLLRTYLNIVGTYVNLNDSIYTNSFFETIEKIKQLEKDISIPNRTKINLYLNTGKIHNTTHNYQLAIDQFQKALLLANQEKYSAKIFIALTGLGVVNKNQGEYTKAASYFNKSRKYIQKNKLYQSTFFNNIADLFLEQKEYEKALHNYNNAITSLLISKKETSYKNLPSIDDISDSPYKRDVLDYLIDKANGWYEYYQSSSDKKHLLEAEKTISLADKIIDLLYFESSEELSKLFWRKKGAELYVRAVSICYLLNMPDKAMYYMEKNRGIFLMEKRNTYKARQLAKIPENVIEKEKNFLISIKNTQKKVWNEDLLEKEKEELKNELFQQKNKFEKFIDSLEIAYPKYYKFKKHLKIQSITETQKNISKNQVIVEYILGKKEGYVLLLTKNKIHFQKIEGITKLNEEINVFKKNISKPFLTKESKNKFQKNASVIFSKIFPFKEFKKQINGKELIVIADGELQYIPFEALSIDAEMQLEASYLLQICDVYYKHSISLEKQMNFYKKNKKQNYVSFIPTTFLDNSLESLHHSKLEMESISPYFKTIFTNKEATKKQFLTSYNNNEIIHISTHGGIDNDIPWLAFSDGKLVLNELYYLENQKELVVLSACKSSVGKHQKGEGLYNLTRGFVSTGAKSVLSTLWNINEKSSAEIMALFYKNIQHKMNKSQALRNAKLTYLTKHKNTSSASPYYWSSFILTGENNALNQKNKWNAILKVGILIIFGLFILGSIRKKF